MTKHRHAQFDVTRPPRSSSGGTLVERADAAFDFDRFMARPTPRPELRPELGPELRPEPGDAPRLPPAASKTTPNRASPLSEARPEPPTPRTVQRLDRQRLRANGYIVPGEAPTALLEEFRIVKRQLLATARERGTPGSRRVLISSPLPGEGKTFCAINLALAMAAERDTQVVLIDADIARPSIPAKLGLDGGGGLMDALANPALDPERLLIATDIDGLAVLPAGAAGSTGTEYIGSDRTAELMEALVHEASDRWLIFDTPPALAASPAAELAKHVGQTVLIARAERTSHTALEDAFRLLSACPDVKLLLNGARFSPSGRQFGTYYGGDDA